MQFKLELKISRPSEFFRLMLSSKDVVTTSGCGVRFLHKYLVSKDVQKIV